MLQCFQIWTGTGVCGLDQPLIISGAQLTSIVCVPWRNVFYYYPKHNFKYCDVGKICLLTCLLSISRFTGRTLSTPVSLNICIHQNITERSKWPLKRERKFAFTSKRQLNHQNTTTWNISLKLGDFKSYFFGFCLFSSVQNLKITKNNGLELRACL